MRHHCKPDLGTLVHLKKNNVHEDIVTSDRPQTYTKIFNEFECLGDKEEFLDVCKILIDLKNS